MFIDEAEVKFEAGKGGDGLVSFRREKFVPRGGPDGGDGGQGGSVFLICKNNVHTLSDFARMKNFKAEDGQAGKSSNGTGKNGQDLILAVPPGTTVWEIMDEKKRIFADILKEGEKVTLCRGGRGGKGNAFFATATEQTPRFSQEGRPGQKQTLKLELKLIAGVGLIGLPNVGKSTLLSRISQAKPKIADYPFTTLSPNLGVAKIDKQEIVFADVPGLIEGASLGKGLGDKFLRHIERTKILVHILDATSNDLGRDYKQIRSELGKFSPKLLSKKEIIVVNKIDTYPDLSEIKTKTGKVKIDLYISAVSGKGMKEFLQTVARVLS